jgi:hypothetical protein
VVSGRALAAMLVLVPQDWGSSTQRPPLKFLPRSARFQSVANLGTTSKFPADVKVKKNLTNLALGSGWVRAIVVLATLLEFGLSTFHPQLLAGSLSAAFRSDTHGGTFPV